MRLSKAILLGCIGLVALFVVYELSRPDVLLVGNVTIDLVDGTKPTGGAVSYAAAALKVFGMSACVVTVAGPDADLSVLDGLDTHVIPANSTLTFEHTYPWFGHQRRLRVTANPNVTIRRSHVPARCRRARIVLLGPLTLFDVDAGSFLATDSFWERLLLGYQHVGLMAQGFQRQLVQGGRVAPLDKPSRQLLDGLGKRVSLFLSDVETDSWPAGSVRSVADRCARLLVTQGSKGAEETNVSGVHHIAPAPVEHVLDTNGAGDTFATSYMVGLAQALPDPAGLASWAASRAVMMPQKCKPHCACDRVQGQQVPHWDARQRLKASLVARGMQLEEAVAWARAEAGAAATRLAAAWHRWSRGPHGVGAGVVPDLLAAALGIKQLLADLMGVHASQQVGLGAASVEAVPA